MKKLLLILFVMFSVTINAQLTLTEMFTPFQIIWQPEKQLLWTFLPLGADLVGITITLMR